VVDLLGEHEPGTALWQRKTATKSELPLRKACIYSVSFFAIIIFYLYRIYNIRLTLRAVFQRILDNNRGWIFILALFYCPLVKVFQLHPLINPAL
jgi:uncharacterized membrane protein